LGYFTLTLFFHFNPFFEVAAFLCITAVMHHMIGQILTDNFENGSPQQVTHLPLCAVFSTAFELRGVDLRFFHVLGKFFWKKIGGGLFSFFF
jgi:hypothetical protein